MPTRPIQHELEDESRLAFESLLGSWVYRRKTPDYGIDGEVEVFDESRKASGQQFLVQLKAALKTKSQPGISLAVEWIKYYQSLELPVLLVLWVKKSGKTFWRWASDIDLYYAKQTKSLTVHLPNAWHDGTRAEIQRHVDFRRHMKAGRFPRPLTICMVAPSRPEAPFHLQRLCTRVPTLLTYRDEAHVTCSLSKGELKIAFSGYYGAVLHSQQNVDEATVAKRALVGVTIALDHFGAMDRAAELWSSLPELSAEVISVDVAWRILSILTRAGAYNDLRATLRALSWRFEQPELMLPLLPLRFTAPVHRRRQLTDLLIELAEERVRQEKTAEGRSITSYTLGRLWEDIDGRRARKFFIQAIRASSFYAKKAYFWRELGASLFNRRRYRAALCCYEHAYKKLGHTERKTRYGDALMHAGHYSDALRVFERIAAGVRHRAKDKDEAHLDWAEAKIKGYVLAYINELYGIASQDRQCRAALECIERDPDIPMLVRCEKAIRADALCNRAWFNRAVALYAQGKHEEALPAFLVAAATATSDDEAWLNALILSLELHEKGLLATLLTYLTHERGASFARYVTDNAQTRSNEKERAMLMEIAKVLVQQIPMREEALIRLHGPRGTTVIKGPVR